MLMSEMCTCGDGDCETCFPKKKWRNPNKIDPHEEAIRDHEFENAILIVRDSLEPIATGEITRGHCLAGQPEAYGGTPGKRKTKLADANRIAKHAIAAINRAVREFHNND